MAAFRQDITELQHVERAVRLQEAPSVSDTVDSIYKLGPLLWTHRPEHTGFLGLRFGLGTAPSRITFEEPNNNDTEAEYMARDPGLPGAVPGHRGRARGLPAAHGRRFRRGRARAASSTTWPAAWCCSSWGCIRRPRPWSPPSPRPSPGNAGTGCSGCPTSARATARSPATTWPPARPAAPPCWPASRTCSMPARGRRARRSAPAPRPGHRPGQARGFPAPVLPAGAGHRRGRRPG